MSQRNDDPLSRSPYAAPRSAAAADPPANDDPLLKSGFREALMVLVLWASAAVYSVGFCAWRGYHRDLDDVRLVWGFPDWVFWGVVVPWVTCAVISGVISIFFMTDDDLGAEVDEEDWENA